MLVISLVLQSYEIVYYFKWFEKYCLEVFKNHFLYYLKTISCTIYTACVWMSRLSIAEM